MPKDLLVKNFPKSLRNWIDDERSKRRVTLKEFVVTTLERVAQQPNAQPSLFDERIAEPVVESASLPFKFIDLFAGIGGIRLGLARVGGQCVFSSEWDVHAQKTYNAWFGETPYGDIKGIRPADIPDHDVLGAGFPCQPFSIAGVSKKNSLGKSHGFKCQTQGTLFFHLATIIEIKRPPVIILENVKNLQSHDSGRTWEVIRSTLNDLGYRIFSRVIDAGHWVPQHRERIFIVGFDRKEFGDAPPFDFGPEPEGQPRLRDILDPNPDAKYTLTNHLWSYLRAYAKRHQAKGNGFGFGLANLDGVTRTLSARYYKDGSEVLIPQGNGRNPRRLTPRECARLMGYPDHLPIVVSDTQAYKQFGNSVVPAVVQSVAREVVKTMSWSLGNNCLLKTNKRDAK